MISPLYKNIIMLAVFLILYTVESLFPYFDEWQGKARHTLRNGGLIAANALITNLILAPLTVLALNYQQGIFSQLEIGFWLELALTILLVDLLTYILHVLFHKVPFLWRFHRVHHSDTQMDVTTGARFHIGEHTISILCRAGLFALFAMKAEYIILYETIFLANVLLHHANLTISEPVDRIYRIFFTSPNMHKVHHSDVRAETDSNYTSLFSFWDRLFGTYTIIANPKRIVYGIKGLEDQQSVIAMQMMPFKEFETKSARGRKFYPRR